MLTTSSNRMCMLNLYKDGNLLRREVLKCPHKHGVLKDMRRWTVRIILEFKNT
jgi:hypothetical protein